jgi:hypothetical protein
MKEGLKCCRLFLQKMSQQCFLYMRMNAAATCHVAGLFYTAPKNCRNTKRIFALLTNAEVIGKKMIHIITLHHPAARQFCRSTYTITDNTIK